MAEEDVMAKGELSNSCCTAWKEKYAKLKERYSKLEEGRIALRKGLSIYELQVSKMQSENLTLKKAYESEKKQAENERNGREKESALRASLESEVDALKTNVLSLQQKSGPASEDWEREKVQLQGFLSEKDAEVSRLKELLENERLRADSEKKKANAERKKADELRKKLKIEKTKADEERRLVESDRKEVEENRLKLEVAMKDVDEVKMKLALETSKAAEMKKKLDTDMQNRKTDRKRADSSILKAAEQTKLADTNLKMAMDEKRRADDLSQQLDQYNQRIEILKKEIVELKSSRILIDNVSDKKREAAEKLAHPEIVKQLEDQKKVLEAYKKKALTEKHRADQLSRDVKDYKKRLGELQKEINSLVSSRSIAESALHSHDRSLKCQTAKISFLEKQLKLEKMLVKHSKGAAELEKARNGILKEELLHLKQDISQFSKRLNLLDDYFICSDEAIQDLEKEKLKNQQFGIESCQTRSHLKDGIALMAAADETDSFRENVDEGIAPVLAISGVNGTRSVSGINSELEPLLKGVNKKVLQSSAINSCSTSFSDRPLVGSQERHSSGTRSDKFAENKSDPKEKCNENLATIVESGVKSPVIDTSTKRSSRHHKKRKRSIDAICSLQSKNEPQQKQVLFLHSVSENQTDKSGSTIACLLPRVEDGIGSFHDRSHKKRKASSEKLRKCHVNDADRVKANLKVLGMQECSILANSIPPVHHRSGTDDNGKDRSDTLGDFELLVGDDYMKLLDLDNSVDEESYRLALQMPLSPELPEIKCESNARVSSNSHLLLDNNNNSLGELSRMKGSLSPLEHFDVLDLEINSNKATHGTIGNSKKSLSPEVSDHANTSSYINGNGVDCPKFLQAHISNSISEPMSTVDVLACANESSKVSSGSRDPNPCHGIPKCCVVFFDNDKVESISAVYSATKNFMNQCSTVSASNLYLRNIVIFISGAQDLSSKEKASVFLSVLLHYISEMETSDLCNGWDRASVLRIASFAHHICTVPSDVNNGMTFDESWNLYELLSLLEDFILHREVLMFDNVCSDSKSSKDSRINLVLNANGVRFVSQEASINLSVAGCILLASLCAEVDHIGFICEASFNTLRMLKSDPSFVLTALHIFAYVCGHKYFGIKQYCFVMAVVRSLVMFLEKLNPPDCSSCFTSLAEDLSKLWSGSNCPFSEGTSSMDGGSSSMDGVTSMLLDKLQNCIWSSTRQKVKVIHPSINGEKNDTENMDISAAPRTADTPYSVTDDGNGCFLTDVLALVELVSCYMSWDWTVENIVRPVSKMMESCPLEHVPAAILVLLAQLGRYGVSANGYEDITIQNLRDRLSALLCGCDSKTVSHEIQFSIAIALLGVVPLNFAEIVERNAEISGFESQYQATICLRKWFSLLSYEEQLSFKHVVSSSECLQNVHIPLVK